MAKRMDSQRRLQSDPNDIEALLTLQEIQMKMQNWCQSNVKPGQFTGELVKNLLPKENLQGGFQAWAKKVIIKISFSNTLIIQQTQTMEINQMEMVPGYLRNGKRVLCFYRVIQTRVEVWENEKCCGNTSRRRVFPQLF